MAAKNPKLASGTWAETDHAGNQRIWERKDSAIERHHVCAEGISITEAKEERDEIEKDIWTLENLDIAYKKNPIKNVQTLNFTAIIQDDLRKRQKRSL